MKEKTSNFFLSLLITFGLFSLALFTFTQTSIFEGFIRIIEVACAQISFLQGFTPYAPLVLILIVYGLIFLLAAFGGKLSFVYYLSLLLYLPSVFAFSNVDWFKLIGYSVSFESFLPFELVLIFGLFLISFRIFLVNLFQSDEIKKELIKRGESSIDEIVHKIINYSAGLLGLSLILGFFAISLLIIASPALSGIISNLGLSLFLGLGSSILLILLIYYYLKKD